MHGNLSLIRSIIFILVRSTVASEAFHQLHEKITNLYRYRHVFLEHVQGVAGKAVIYLEHTRTLTSACNLCTAARSPPEEMGCFLEEERALVHRLKGLLYFIVLSIKTKVLRMDKCGNHVRMLQTNPPKNISRSRLLYSWMFKNTRGLIFFLISSLEWKNTNQAREFQFISACPLKFKLKKF